ncbi:hypothetical protein ACFLR7_07145 [Acidobacteriota bacterium]
MDKNRITYFGWTDYSVASLELIIDDLKEYLTSTEAAIKRLEGLEKDVEKSSRHLDDPDSIAGYIEFSRRLFESFKYDLNRVLDEIQYNVNEVHPEIIHSIYERSVYEEKESNRGFKSEHIVRDLKDESYRPLVDEIYETSGN